MALTLAVALTCGCSVIPVGSPTSVEEAADGDLMTRPFVRMIASPPQAGWTPEQVVSGTLSAMAAYPDDPRTLMGYFTQKARNAWKPAGPVVVLDDAKVKETGEGKIELSGNKIATIEGDDRYVPATGKAVWIITLKKEAGGWRVDTLEPAPGTSESAPGLVLTAADVERAYRPTLLYYLNGTPRPDSLVSDAVRLRRKPGENLAETILRRLIKGPSSALQGAVGTSLSDSVDLDSVTATDEKVVISLSGKLDLDNTDGLEAQLRASLREVAAAQTIDVLLDGEPLITGIEATAADPYYPSMKSPAYYTSSSAVHSMGPEGPGNPIAGQAGQQNPYTDIAMSRNGDKAAGLMKGDGIYAANVAPNSQWERVIEGDLTSPSWHRDGSLWAYDKRSRIVVRSDFTGPPARVAAPQLDGQDVTDLRVARDGVRVAVGLGTRKVSVGAIIGGSLGMMLGNFQPLLEVGEEEQVLDIAWRDGEHLLVLVSGKAGQTVREIDVGDGETTTLTSDKRLNTIAALGQNIFAGTVEPNEILEYKEQQGWTSKIKEAAQTPIFPLG